jgi:1-acyl-sn-glycerol-3-phosphate acyltransferase
MEPTQSIRVSRKLVLMQALLGIGVYLTVAFPYLRRVRGWERLRRGQQYLFVANHVSLLDTILLGGLCWRSGWYPILVLGDRNVWNASWFKRMMSWPVSFLLDRGKLNPGRIRELQAFGRAGKEFQLIVFPEGTRGDGVTVADCQPGIYFIAQEARLPIVPLFFENMQLVSTKDGPMHLIAGLRKVELHVGEPIVPEKYLNLPRKEFLEFLRQSIVSARVRTQESPEPVFKVTEKTSNIQ